jgi:hypothetical protein
MSDLRAAIIVALVVCASACQFDHDTVGAGYYGSTQAGATATPTAGQTVQGAGGMNSSAAGSSSPSSSAGTGAGAAAGSGTGSGGMAAGSSAMSTAGSMAMTTAGAAAASGAPSGAAGAGTGATSAAGEGAAGMMTEPVSACDLSGKWLSTVHYVTDALGQLQYAHVYIYYEIEQKGDAFTITKSLHCGDDAIGGGALAATVDFKSTWASCMTRVSYTGRKGTSVEAAGGCKVDLEKWYTVRGATLPYYLDPTRALPGAENMASGSTPGWEDWDGDGNPGISGSITGAVTGKIFVAPRQWSQLSGTVADVKSVFKLPLQWDQEQNVMSYDGSPLLATGAVRAADASLHFVQFARLSAEQAAGDDAAICRSVTTLAPTLTPEAAGM